MYKLYKTQAAEYERVPLNLGPNYDGMSRIGALLTPAVTLSDIIDTINDAEETIVQITQLGAEYTVVVQGGER